MSPLCSKSYCQISAWVWLLVVSSSGQAVAAAPPEGGAEPVSQFLPKADVHVRTHVFNESASELQSYPIQGAPRNLRVQEGSLVPPDVEDWARDAEFALTTAKTRLGSAKTKAERSSTQALSALMPDSNPMMSPRSSEGLLHPAHQEAEESTTQALSTLMSDSFQMMTPGSLSQSNITVVRSTAWLASGAGAAAGDSFVGELRDGQAGDLAEKAAVLQTSARARREPTSCEQCVLPGAAEKHPCSDEARLDCNLKVCPQTCAGKAPKSRKCSTDAQCEAYASTAPGPYCPEVNDGVERHCQECAKVNGRGAEVGCNDPVAPVCGENDGAAWAGFQICHAKSVDQFFENAIAFREVGNTVLAALPKYPQSARHEIPAFFSMKPSALPKGVTHYFFAHPNAALPFGGFVYTKGDQIDAEIVSILEIVLHDSGEEGIRKLKFENNNVQDCVKAPNNANVFLKSCGNQASPPNVEGEATGRPFINRVPEFCWLPKCECKGQGSDNNAKGATDEMGRFLFPTGHTFFPSPLMAGVVMPGYEGASGTNGFWTKKLAA